MNYVPSRRSLWVFDFDGTLSPIVPDRNEARLHRRCDRMLRFLARSPWNRVAVLSSRTLDDVVSRVSVPGIFIGGASGLEWRLPGGLRIGPGVEIEDKGWSVAIYYRNTSPRSFRRRVSLLKRLRNRKGIKVFRGPGVVEVQMMGYGGKSAGVRRLCQLADRDPIRERIVYAGDDENDAVAIRDLEEIVPEQVAGKARGGAI